MVVKKIVERFRNKGYDDFWLADLAETHEGAIFSLIFFLSLIVSVLPFVALTSFLGETFFVAFGPFLGILEIPSILYLFIRTRKQMGETDQRLMYMVSSKISKICLKAMRYAPIISTCLLVVFLIKAIIQYGFQMKMLMAFAISLILLLLFARPYHKLLSRVMKEAVYYVDWKTHELVDHFEERYSGYEIWRIPSSEIDFEQFNVWFFRNICQTTFVSVSIGCLAGIIYALSFSPMSCMLGYNKSDKEQPEQLYENSSIEEVKTVQTAQTQVATKEIEEEIEGDVTQEDWEDVLANEENYSQEGIEVQKAEEEQKQENVIEPEKEETEGNNNNRIEYFALNQLDEIPTMSDGTSLSRGVIAYLREQIPELKGKYAYVEYKLSPTGKVTDVDASLVDDRVLQEKIRNSLLSMPIVIPGKKDGQSVYVKTNITIEK